MTTTSVYNPSDEDCDDIDVQLNGQVTGHHTLARSRSGLNGTLLSLCAYALELRAFKNYTR